MLRVSVLFVCALSLVHTKEGSCPPSIPVDMCEAQCADNAACAPDKLCCPTACGGAMCVDAMTKRHFVTQVKPGRCPEVPRGIWMCTATCTSDSDCPRALKCCANRCGALTCLKPDAEPTNDEENTI